MPFIPPNVDLPSGSGQFLSKFKPGKTTVRILAEPLFGLILWTQPKQAGSSNVPVRRPLGSDMSDLTPAIGRDGKPERVKVFAACPVIDRTDGQIKVMDLTQSSIIGGIDALSRSSWGDPWNADDGYDVTIVRTDDSGRVNYTVHNEKPVPLSDGQIEQWNTTGCDLSALFRGEYPFGASDNGQSVPPPPAPTHQPKRSFKASEAGEPQVGPAQTVKAKVTLVEDHKMKNGQTRYRVVLDNGLILGTFSKTLATNCRQAVELNHAAIVSYTTDTLASGQRVNNLTGIVPDTEGEAGTDIGAEDDDIPNF